MFLRIPKCRDFNIHVLMVSPKHLWVEAGIISSFSLGVIPKTLRVCSFCPFLYFDSFHLFYTSVADTFTKVYTFKKILFWILIWMNVFKRRGEGMNGAKKKFITQSPYAF